MFRLSSIRSRGVKLHLDQVIAKKEILKARGLLWPASCRALGVPLTAHPYSARTARLNRAYGRPVAFDGLLGVRLHGDDGKPSDTASRPLPLRTPCQANSFSEGLSSKTGEDVDAGDWQSSAKCPPVLSTGWWGRQNDG